ncbi:unnamed protein product, partial [Mesorhabditis spiculigera]
MQISRLPLECLKQVLDHLEPDELIALQRTTRDFRRRINDRGLLPGRIRKLSIHGLYVHDRPDQLKMSGIYVVVESRGGVNICTGYPHKRLYHTVDRADGDTGKEGYPRNFGRFGLGIRRMMMRRYRMKSARYFVQFARLLQRIRVLPVLSINVHDTGVSPDVWSPFHDWHYSKLVKLRKRSDVEPHVVAWYAKTKPIQMGQVIGAFRVIEKCCCNSLTETVFPHIKALFNCVPDVFQNRGAAFVYLRQPLAARHQYCQDHFEHWPSRALIWQNLDYDEAFAAIQDLLPRSPSLPPGRLYTHFGDFRPVPANPAKFVWDMLVQTGLRPLSANSAGSLYLQCVFDRHVSEEFGQEIGTCFFYRPHQTIAVALMLRLHQKEKKVSICRDVHATMSVMAFPQEIYI